MRIRNPDTRLGEDLWTGKGQFPMMRNAPQKKETRTGQDDEPEGETREVGVDRKNEIE